MLQWERTDETWPWGRGVWWAGPPKEIDVMWIKEIWLGEINEAGGKQKHKQASPSPDGSINVTP
jgi:hypothetical protein